MSTGSTKSDGQVYGQQELKPLISITPQPSAVFSTTSSVESSAEDCGSDEYCVDDDDDDDDIGIHLEEHGECIGAEHERENENENEIRYCEQEPEEFPTAAILAAADENNRLITTASQAKQSSWKTRIVEFFVIQILLLVSMVLYSQNSNRMSLKDARVVEGSETARLPREAFSNTASADLLVDHQNKIDGSIVESDAEDCIYVPGGGFSGFWFSLGRLHSLQNPHNETYVCYSAGCMGVVTTLLHHGERLANGATVNNNDSDDNDNNYQHMYEIARSIQIEWQSGNLHRYRVVESFVHGLLEKIEASPDDESKALFLDTIRNKLNIVTTAFEGPIEESEEHIGGSRPSQQQLLPPSIFPQAYVRRPSDIASLKRMLLQSAWIPLATGSSWTHRGHMDGSFSMAQHPRCARTVGLEFLSSASTLSITDRTAASSTVDNESLWRGFLRKQFLLLANVLNMKLSREDVTALWNIGVEQGV